MFLSVQKMTDTELVRRLGGYIWPRGDGREERAVRRRVTLAMGLMSNMAACIP